MELNICGYLKLFAKEKKSGIDTSNLLGHIARPLTRDIGRLLLIGNP